MSPISSAIIHRKNKSGFRYDAKPNHDLTETLERSKTAINMKLFNRLRGLHNKSNFAFGASKSPTKANLFAKSWK